MATVELQHLDEIRRTVMMLTGNRVDPARATELINTTLRTLWHDWSWSQAKVDTIGVLKGIKNRGVVTLGFNRAQVNGLDTSFLPSDVGSYLRVSSQVTYLKVIGVSGQQLTLETEYVGAPFVEASYVLFRHIYPLPADFRQMLSPSYWDYLTPVPQQHLDAMDPLRLVVDQMPSHYAMHGRDADYVQLIEIWPVPSVSIHVRYSYLKALPAYSVLDGAAIVPLRGDLVAYMAAAEALMVLAAEARSRQDSSILMSLAERWLTLGRGILGEAQRADRFRFGVPESVPPYRPWAEEIGAYFSFAPAGTDGLTEDDDSRRMAITWVELEVPPRGDDVRRIGITWVEVEVPPGASRSVLIPWVEVQVPDIVPARRTVISQVALEVPDGPDRVVLIPWVEVEVPDVAAPRRTLISQVALEVPSGPDRATLISWVALEVPEGIQRRVLITHIEVEVPAGPDRSVLLSWVELETP